MKKRVLCTVLMVMMLLSVGGCGSNKKETGEEVNPTLVTTETVIKNIVTPVVSATPVIETIIPAIESAMPEETNVSETENKEREVILYIGMEGMVKEYKYFVSGKLTAEKLIAGIADMTGWNLDLADKVTSGKGGMTVCFANTSALFVGPPETQKEEFMVYDKEELIMTVLESVKQTLQYNFADKKLGDPSCFGIYFCKEGNIELEFSDISKYVPLDKPYTELKSLETIPLGKIEGKFMGFADTTTVEVKIGKKSFAYQVLDEQVIEVLNNFEEGTVFTFQVSEEDGVNTIKKVFKK